MENDHTEAHVPRLALAPIMAAALPIAAMASSAPVTVTTRATSAEPVGGSNHSPFSCPAAAAQASAISASGLFADGTPVLVLDERPAPGSFQVPGKSYNSASSYGNPFTLQLTDTVDGALSTGRYARASGTLTGQVHVAAGMATLTLAGDVTLAP